MAPETLFADPARAHLHEMTGLFVRAKFPDGWGTANVLELTDESFQDFVCGRGTLDWAFGTAEVLAKELRSIGDILAARGRQP